MFHAIVLSEQRQTVSITLVLLPPIGPKKLNNQHILRLCWLSGVHATLVILTTKFNSWIPQTSAWLI